MTKWLDETRETARALREAIDSWTGADLDPVIVEARQLLGIARAKILQAEVVATAKGEM